MQEAVVLLRHLHTPLQNKRKIDSTAQVDEGLSDKATRLPFEYDVLGSFLIEKCAQQSRVRLAVDTVSNSRKGAGFV